MTSIATLFDLTGRGVIVTGGSRGLGFQIATALGEMGASVGGHMTGQVLVVDGGMTII